MKVAAVQTCPPWAQPAAARVQLAALVHDAGAQGADLIVCPEMATSGYVFSDPSELDGVAEPARGDTFAKLSPIAQAHGAWIVCGFPERAPDGLYNSALVIGPSGQLVDCYRKNLLFDLDTTWARPGNRRPIYRTALGRMTPAICMDLNDDAFGLHLLVSRPDVVAFPTNWVDEGMDILDYWRMRLFGWRGVLVAADRWGEERGVRFYGRSAVLGPGGAVLGMLPAQGDGVLVVDLAMQAAASG